MWYAPRSFWKKIKLNWHITCHLPLAWGAGYWKYTFDNFKNQNQTILPATKFLVAVVALKKWHFGITDIFCTCHNGCNFVLSRCANTKCQKTIRRITLYFILGSLPGHTLSLLALFWHQMIIIISRTYNI